MKWFRIIFAAFLLVAMLLGVSSVAYADPGDDPGLDVDIVVVGDNPNVDMGIYGDNPQVWINGHNLNDPFVVYNALGAGADMVWVNQRIDEELASFLQSWISEYGDTVDLTVEGLARVISLVQEHSSEIRNLEASLDSQGHVAGIWESDSAQRISTLESQLAQVTANLNDLEDSYNLKLAIIIGAFSLVVIGLATGLVMLWRQT